MKILISCNVFLKGKSIFFNISVYNIKLSNSCSFKDLIFMLEIIFSNLSRSTCLQIQTICVKQTHLVETQYKKNIIIKENKMIKHSLKFKILISETTVYIVSC